MFDAALSIIQPPMTPDHAHSIYPGFFITLSSRPAGKADITFNKSTAQSITPATSAQQAATTHLHRTSGSGMAELATNLIKADRQRATLRAEITLAQTKLVSLEFYNLIAKIFIIGFFIRSIKTSIAQKKEELAAFKEQLERTLVDVDIQFDSTMQDAYEQVASAYSHLLTTHRIWDITASHYHDRKITRSAASTLVTRVPVTFRHDNIDIIRSSFPAFHLENKNGGDLYIYPSFAIITTNQKQLELTDLKDLRASFREQRFIEEGRVPSDTKVLEHTWARVNKNGQRDKRFSHNYQIPVVRYGEITFSTSRGLGETYAFSSYENAERFAAAFNAYRETL
jgi:hypothetical protein